MNGGTILAGYLLVGLGLSLTTAPPGTPIGLRVVMVPGWAFFMVAAVLLVVAGEGRE